MPSATQRTVNIDITNASLGPINGHSTSGTSRLAAMFPGSPIHRADRKLTPQERRDAYTALSLSTVVNDGGHTFTSVSTDYVNAPDLNDVNIQDLNLPSPYVPNPTSPGPGSTDASNKPPAPQGFGQTPSATFGSGPGSALSPKESSANIAKQTLGDYALGRSVKTSQG